MKPTSFLLNLTSEDRDTLMAFYRDIVGLPPQEGMEEFALQLPQGASLAFDGHSDTHGRTKEPSRVLINLFVDDINSAQAELEGRGVSFFRNKGVEYWGGIISSFEDPDGNYVQLIQFDPSLAREESVPATA
ncbi:MAG: VOC family protein [Tepidiformaceae bacterium]